MQLCHTPMTHALPTCSGKAGETRLTTSVREENKEEASVALTPYAQLVNDGDDMSLGADLRKCVE